MRCQDGLWHARNIYQIVIRCSADGRWLPEVSCVEISCDEPPFVSYADLITTVRGATSGARV